MARTKRKVNPVLPLPIREATAKRIYRTGGYGRLSVEDGGKPGADTLESQEELIRSYIESQPDMEFCGLYCDNGQTGTNFERPAFDRLMADVKAGKIDCIVVKDLSRFGRNYKETGNYLERIFPFMDVRFVAVCDNFDTLTAERTNGGFIVPLKNIINEAYSKDISRKVSSALEIKQQNGQFIGAWAAYGYQKCADDPHRIEPDEETAPVVWDIFQWRLSGMSYAKITRRLNECGIPSPSRYHYLRGDAKCERYANAVWRTAIVKVILANEVYLGHLVQGRKRESFYEGKKQRVLPKSEWTIVRNTHEAIIDEATFAAVQKIAVEQRAAYHERLGKYDSLGTTPNILKGLIFCADCKRPLVRYKNVANKGTRVYYTFICPSHADDPASCPKKYFHESELTEILWDTLQKQLALADDISNRVRRHIASPLFASDDAALRREMDAARQTLERAELLHDSLFQMYADKLLTEQEYTQMKRDYQAEMEQAQKTLNALSEKKKTRTVQTEQNLWLTTCACFQGETQLTAEMAHALIERVEIGPDSQLSITLRYQDEYRLLLALLASDGKAVSA